MEQFERLKGFLTGGSEGSDAQHLALGSRLVPRAAWMYLRFRAERPA